jgi:hypothetical protein
MARMIPSVIAPEIKSNAERRIFEWFRDDPKSDDWIVLHSLGISNHNKVIYGEVDFFVLAPYLGLFAIEVKGGRVKRDRGIWYFTNKYGSSGKKERGPFDQARDGVFSIVEALKSRLDSSHKNLEKVFYGIGVMFPDIEYSTVGVDEEQWQVFDCNDGKDVGSFIHRIAEGARKKWEAVYGLLNEERLPTNEDIEYIASILRGDFDKAVSISTQLRYTEESLIDLTKEQYRCLDQLDDNQRCLIYGAAGTGKTILAIEETKKAVAKGEKVALFCFNNNLGDWLRHCFSDMPKSLQPSYVGTFHKYMINVIREQGVYIRFPRDEEQLPEFYSEDVPVAARIALRDRTNLFDKIIIDEAQDLILPQYLEIMDLCLKKGFERGRWTMFGDFTMQAIYSGGRTGEELKQVLEDRTAFIRFKLTINCRNTKPICEEIQTVTGFHAPNELWTKVDGPPVNYITYSNADEQRERLQALLVSLLDNHIAEKKITILSPFKRENSIVSVIEGYDIRDFRAASTNKITFCTIQGYKGLENTVIILTDIETFRSDKMMYVALSRARSGLYILESDSAHKEYLELLQRRFVQ